jgi:hypothetical protein
MAKLLREFIDIKDLSTCITEAKDSPMHKPEYRVRGPFLQAEIKNKNGRTYGLPVCIKSVKMYNEEKISKNRALGQMGHPDVPEIQLDRVSHKIESLEMVNNDGIGVAKFIDTPLGRIGMTYIDEGIILGMSTRSLGTTDNQGNVQDDLNVIAIDTVYDPSAPKALVEGIVENTEWIVGPDGNFVVESAIKNLKKEINKKYTNEVAADVFLKFINEISLKSQIKDIL